MEFKNMKIKEELHRRLKLEAVKSGLTMVGLIEEMLNKRAKEEENK